LTNLRQSCDKICDHKCANFWKILWQFYYLKLLESHDHEFVIMTLS